MSVEDDQANGPTREGAGGTVGGTAGTAGAVGAVGTAGEAVGTAGEAAGAAGEAAGGLEPYRRRLDELDETIAQALGERFEVCRQIAFYKREHAIPMMQPGRVDEVRSRYQARGAEVNLPADFTGSLFELLIAATCRMEDELMATGPSGAPGETDTTHTGESAAPAWGAHDGGRSS